MAQIADGTYFAKCRYTGKYQLCMGGEVVGEVATRKEATAWWKREMRREELYVRAQVRAASGRFYARLMGQ